MKVPCTGLLALPRDLLIILPEYLRDIEDFKNLSSTCSALRNLYSSTSPRIILRLAAAASRTFFRPSPHFLVAATARQLSAWAALSPSNTSKLQTAFRGGIDSLLELSLAHSGVLTIQRIRELHELRFSTINPAIDLVDKCVGVQWSSTPNFWTGGVDDAYTVDVESDETLFHLTIYGDLFARDFDVLFPSLLGPESPGPTPYSLGLDARLDYIKYCIPDWVCYACAREAGGVLREDGTIDPRRVADPIGPYAAFADEKQDYAMLYSSRMNQIGLLHLLRSKRWRRAWASIREKAGADFEDGGWKQDLWESVVLYQGLDGMGWMVRAGQLESGVRERLERWRGMIDALTPEPVRIVVGWQETYEFPFLSGDLEICTSGYASGT